MAPTPQEYSSSEHGAGAEVDPSERVVISGMSGLYPNARHVADLADILYNKKNPISSENLRWTYEHPEVSQFVGKLPELELFDAQFFKVHYRLGNAMDAMSRKILEQTYQALYDAGVSPGALSGKKIAVFVGSCYSEAEKASFYVATSRTGFGIAGCNKSMFANRISYWLNLKGPSMAIDVACCSSTAAVELAFLAITRGECEGAIVAGSHLTLHPQSSIHCSRVMRLSKDGATRSFDENAAGCAKSEAINVLFLQKAKDALRVYAQIVHVKTEFNKILEGETGPKYGFYRDPIVTTNFLKKFYEDAGIPAQAVEFVEAFGSATPEADKEELEAISNVFCKDRSEPLVIGSVMSNIGYAEAATGINSLTKVLLGYQRGQLACNLHCEKPRGDVAALREGRICVATDHVPFNRAYVAVNGLSITGVNAHVLLHGNYKPKDPSRYKSNIPYLVTISGRQESSVRIVLDDLKSRPVDPEELALFHNIHQYSTSGHLGRGFIILDKQEENKTLCLSEKVEYFDDAKRPLWFVYSGMGSQWAGMGEHLMRIPIFAAAIERCRRVLEPKGVDILNIITSHDKTIFDNILNSFVGIAAIQIGLTDVLREIGLVPDKIIGHSVGELGCAYADGCFTAEEMILSAYSRGLVSIQTPFIRGSMAAVGIGFTQISSMCPPEIEVACHNGPDSCTISGPADVMREFVAQLVAQNIFAKEVPCSNIAYHSRYIAEAGPQLLKYLSEVIKDPKARSERWVSTSVPMDRWDEESAKYSSAEYHTNNLLRPVLFEETSRLVPANAVLVEIAPHGLLQAILKRSLPAACRNVPLTRRGHPDNARLLLEAVGQLYMAGYYPRVQALYPKIEFPVSTETPMLSHLVEWAHHEKWLLPLYASAARKRAAATRFVLSIHDEEHRYLQGNVIKGKILYPFAAVLVAVWDTLAMSLNAVRRQLSVQFREVALYAQPILHERRQLRLAVALHRGTGRFEVMDGHSKVASGFITSEQDSTMTEPCEFDADVVLDQNTVYQLLSMRDFSYRDDFRSIRSANATFTKAHILWRENWVTLIDGMLQLNVLRHPHKTVSVPNVISKININLGQLNEDDGVHIGNDVVKVVNVSDDGKFTRCKGIVIEQVSLHDLPVGSPEDNLINLKTLKYVPHFQCEKTDLCTSMYVYLQIVAENINKNNINVLEIISNKTKSSAFDDIENILKDIPGIGGVYKRIEWNKILEDRDSFLNNVDVLLVSDLAVDDHLCQILYRVLPRDNFIVTKEDASEVVAVTRPSALYRVICSHNINSGNLELVRWRPTTAAVPTSAISVHSPSDLDLLSATQRSLMPRQTLLVLTSYPPIPGLKQLIVHWRKEYDRKINLAMINHKLAEDQNLDQMPNLDLTFNILDHGKWGGEYYVPLQPNTSLKGDLTLRCGRVGDLGSLSWVQSPKCMESGVKVAVHYAGVNDLDVKRANGIIPFDCAAEDTNKGFGMDFSGLTDTGERVMGIVRRGALSSSQLVPSTQLWPVPAHWSLEDAATVPLAYCLAYYCLVSKLKARSVISYVGPERIVGRTMKNGLRHQHRVLVHAGAGALGQAVISVALGMQCEVFTTVSSVAKKRFLLKLFPNLKGKNIGNSRDLSFGDMILSATDGYGVDQIICCLNGELKNISIKCGARLSYVFDIQIHDRENYDFGMYNMSKEIMYNRADLLSILNNENVYGMKRLQQLIGEGIARGWVRPLSRVVYEPCDVVRAFRLLASGNQRGRALLRMFNLSSAQHSALPRLQCSSDMYHLILCDSELGIQLADKLIRRGVRKLMIRGYSQLFNLDYKISLWRKSGVEINEPTEEVPNALHLEPNILSNLEAVYVVITDCGKLNEYTSLLSNLDSLTRQFYSPLKYFAVISTDDSFGIQICNSRRQDRLPATVINIPTIIKMCDTVTSPSREEDISLRQAAAVVEQALCSSGSNVLAHVNVCPKPSFLQRLETVAGIRIPKNAQNTSTLSDLGFGVEKSNELHAFLRDMYNISLAEEKIPHVTIQMLGEIEEILKCSEFENVTGLGTFFSYVDADELLATTEIVRMPTMSSGVETRDDEFDLNETYLYIVPGVEGHHGRFRELCERLKLPAMVLQPGLHCPQETVRELAHRYVKILLEKTGLKTNFYLLGYESGVLVALEVAALLEDYGLTGTVFCLGAPPAEFNEELREHLHGLETEEALQDAVVRHMFTLMTGDKGTEGSELEGALRGVKAWREKVEVAVRLLLGRVSHSAQYARQLIEAARGRLESLLQHEGEPRALHSRLVLLRSAPAPPCAAALQPHSKQPVVVHSLRAPLAHATQDQRCAAIINSHLDDSCLQAFERKNLCETYLLGAEAFMTSI